MVARQYGLRLDGHKIVAGDKDGRQVEVGFKRTIRVPDNNQVSQLSPDLGNFPVYKVKDYADKLPKEMAQKGGVFLPIYQREAMWINLSSRYPFLIKIYAGGVNVVSGESHDENLATKFRRHTLQAEGKSIQDYVITPRQRWIDGIATSPGVVGQFVSMATGSGHSVEAQVTGKEDISGLLFEITPAGYPSNRGWTKPESIYVETLTGKIIPLETVPDDTMYDLKHMVHVKEGFPPEQVKLIYRGTPLEDSLTVQECGIFPGATLRLVLALRGGGDAKAFKLAKDKMEMSIAKGGRIAQTIAPDFQPSSKWKPAHTMAFNVQLLNSTAFTKVTGLAPPETPVSIDTYNAAGLPFFKMYEEPSLVHGNFDNVQSIGELDKTIDPVVKPRLISLNPDKRQPTAAYEKLKTMVDDTDGLLDPVGPLREFRTASGMKKELGDMRMNDL